LALLDVKLPDMSGFDVCRRLKSDPATSSILVIQNSASFVGAEDKVRGLEGGADTYLTAPIEPAVLLATVGAMLRLSRAESELRQKGEALQRLVDSERAARAQAERADRLKDEFVATLSHELRNPLVAISGWVALLKGTHPDAETLALGLNVIERGCRTQRKLIEDLLDMSRIMSGKLRLDVREVDLAAIIESVVSSSQLAADAKAISIERGGDRAPRPILGDAARLQQVVWNLVSNAIKFTPRGGRMRIGLERRESEMCLTVVDSGIGIDAKFLPHVFERFRQADSSTTRRFGGLGIGLSIVKSLTELHGGTVAVSSAGDGQGTTFSVFLPVAAPHRAAMDDKSPSTHVEPKGGTREILVDSNALEGMRLLVVDDDPDAVDLLVRIFTNAGAEVASATSAEEALHLLRASRPDAGAKRHRHARSGRVQSGAANPSDGITLGCALAGRGTDGNGPAGGCRAGEGRGI
jgi:signal transduction histidine kinase